MRLVSKVKTRILCGALLGAAAVIGHAHGQEGKTGQGRSFGQQLLAPLMEAKVDSELLNQSKPANTVVTINLGTQRLEVSVSGKTGLATPANTGRKTNPTPVGEFKIKTRAERLPTSAYGNFVDDKGRLLVAGVYQKLDPVPTGAKFAATPQKFVLRLDGEGLTILSGHVRSSPATDGSIVVPEKIARLLYERIADGTPVKIVR